jgi:AraC-like DNA-binding protein
MARRPGRQSRAESSGKGIVRARRPKYLFSGLTKCAVCGGGYILSSRDTLRCFNALTWLKEEDEPVSEMASRLGYESEAAFSRAFKRFLGFPPGAVRRAKSDQSAPAPDLHG